VAEPKPFGISKRAVWEAYQAVQANRGAAGVDRQSLEGVEHDLINNLYTLWNRLASGSYFPPPVLMVEIPKRGGGTRRLGVPTVSDRIAQMVVKRALEPCVEPYFHKDSYGYRPGKSLSRRWASRANAAGSTTTCWSLTSRVCSMKSIMTMTCSCVRWTNTRTAGGCVCTLDGGSARRSSTQTERGRSGHACS